MDVYVQVDTSFGDPVLFVIFTKQSANSLFIIQAKEDASSAPHLCSEVFPGVVESRRALKWF